MTRPTLLTAYYLDSHVSGSCVPRSLRNDFAWMADHGTNAVGVTVLEQTLTLGRANMDIVCDLAHRAGLKVLVTPSRWGQLVAGAPGVPSSFGMAHPEAWVRQQNGSPSNFGSNGAYLSVHHPATVDFCTHALESILRQWPIDGITWDEPKTMQLMDYSPAANRPPGATLDFDIDAVCAFFENLSGHAKSLRPDLILSMFVYGDYLDPKGLTYLVQKAAAIKHIDYFGCDGRPWYVSDDPGGYTKVLLPNARAFLDEAHANGKGGMILAENAFYDPGTEQQVVAIQPYRLPEVLELPAEHIAYYYYGVNVADPESNMAVMSKALLGAFTGPAPTPVSVALDPLEPMKGGEPSTVSATFTDDASAGQPIQDSTLSLRLPAGWDAQPLGDVSFPSVQPGQQVRGTWNITPPGDFFGSAKVYALASYLDPSGQRQRSVLSQAEVALVQSGLVENINPSYLNDPRPAQVGVQFLVDRTYTITSLPTTLAGGVLIPGANADKGATSPADYLTFNVTRDVTVYAVFDLRGQGTWWPSWLADDGFTLTGMQIETSDHPYAALQMQVPAGPVSLGPNLDAPASNLNSYFTVVLPA